MAMSEKSKSGDKPRYRCPSCGSYDVDWMDPWFQAIEDAGTPPQGIDGYTWAEAEYQRGSGPRKFQCQSCGHTGIVTSEMLASFRFGK
jgi:predicted RNA-binding Zn-ribbon protein involved in translation (DUF1610 family)